MKKELQFFEELEQREQEIKDSITELKEKLGLDKVVEGNAWHENYIS